MGRIQVTEQELTSMDQLRLKQNRTDMTSFFHGQTSKHLNFLLGESNGLRLFNRGYRFQITYKLMKCGLQFVYKITRYDRVEKRMRSVLNTKDSSMFKTYLRALDTLE